MELDTPGLFERIAVEGQSFAESYLSETAVSQYAAELIRAYAKTFRFRAAITASVAGTNAPMDSTLQDNRFVPLNLIYLGHIQNRGDVNVTDGTWLRRSRQQTVDRGFHAVVGRRPQGDFIPNRARGRHVIEQFQPGASSPVHAVATHPIFGFHINCDGEAEARLKMPVLRNFRGRCDRWACFCRAGSKQKAWSRLRLCGLRCLLPCRKMQRAPTDARLPAPSDLGPFEDQAKQASAAGPGPDQDTIEVAGHPCSPTTPVHRQRPARTSHAFGTEC